MTPLLILSALLILGWLWSVWQRDGAAAAMAEWSYVPLVGGLMCLVMALGLWIR